MNFLPEDKSGKFLEKEWQGRVSLSMNNVSGGDCSDYFIEGTEIIYFRTI